MLGCQKYGIPSPYCPLTNRFFCSDHGGPSGIRLNGAALIQPQKTARTVTVDSDAAILAPLSPELFASKGFYCSPSNREQFGGKGSG